MSLAADPNGPAAAPSESGGSPPPLFGASEEPSERLMNAFVLVFLVVLVLCMMLSHQMGHKLKLKYLAEAGAVVLVGMLLGGIVMLASHGKAQEWLRDSIEPTTFFIGPYCPLLPCMHMCIFTTHSIPTD